MTEQLVTLETAQLAQKKGYDLHVCRCGGYPDCICYDLKPTQSLLQRWLREEHEIFVFANYRSFGIEECNGWYYHIGKSVSYYSPDKFKTYEEALEAGLCEGLYHIK